jgi:predicted NUDIX family NTP pyrophosphohydrolase
MLEWPKGSGIREYPEVDRGAWFGLEQARTKMHKGQVGFLDRLLERLLAPGSVADHE